MLHMDIKGVSVLETNTSAVHKTVFHRCKYWFWSSL